jgi:hypothetical protein
MKIQKITPILFVALLSTAACSQHSLSSDGANNIPNSDGTTDDGSQNVVETPSTPEAGEDTSFRLDQEVNKFKTRYGLKDPYTKLLDNKGKGYSDLWGARNFRVVLHGVLYRGGANNKYFDPPRSNTNPLPTKGLQNLCEDDFAGAVYLYSENYKNAPKSVKCKNTSHQDNTFTYHQNGPYNEADLNKILTLVYNRIKGKLTGPIYAHCWNGWHASGVVAGVALKQFCGWSDAAAEKYWIANTDGNSSGHESTKARLKKFKPLAQFKISKEEQALICPTM